MADSLDADGLRNTLNRVIGYRNLQKAVRSSGKHNLFWGGLFLLLWYMFGRNFGFDRAFSYIYLGIAVMELGVGLLKQVYPSAECILLDAVVMLAFAGSRLLWVYYQVQEKKPVDTIALLIGLYFLYQAWSTFQGYQALRRAYPERPTGEHIRYVNELIREVRSGDPDTDPTAIDLSAVGLKVKLLGDLALFADPAGGVFVADREAVELVRTTDVDPSGRPVVRLRLYGNPHPEFGVSESSWRNYARWKGVAA